MEETYLQIYAQSTNSISIDKNTPKIDLEDYYEDLSYQDIIIKLDEVNELDEHKNIACLTGYFYDFDYIFNYGTDIFTTFDMTNGDTSAIYSVLFEGDEIKPEYETWCSNIFYINRIYVEKEYRNQGYAKFILRQIEDILKYIAKVHVGIIIVCAQPYEHEDSTEKMIRDDYDLTNKLINLYKQSGFEIAKTDFDSETYLIKICDEEI